MAFGSGCRVYRQKGPEHSLKARMGTMPISLRKCQWFSICGVSFVRFYPDPDPLKDRKQNGNPQNDTQYYIGEAGDFWEVPLFGSFRGSRELISNSEVESETRPSLELSGSQ